MVHIFVCAGIERKVIGGNRTDLAGYKKKRGTEIRLSNQYNERKIYKTNKNKS